MRVCPGDAAALAAPDSVTLKRCCCREPPWCSRGGCANPAAPRGLCWGSQRRPSPGSCQVGRAPGRNSSSPSPGKGLSQPAQGAWPGDGCQLPCSAAAGVHTHSLVHTPCAPEQGEGLCSPRCCFPLCSQSWREAVKPAVSTKPSPCRKTQRTQGLQGGHREFSASHAFAAHSQAADEVPAPMPSTAPGQGTAPWPGKRLIRRVPCRVIGSMVIS